MGGACLVLALQPGYLALQWLQQHVTLSLAFALDHPSTGPHATVHRHASTFLAKSCSLSYAVSGTHI